MTTGASYDEKFRKLFVETALNNLGITNPEHVTKIKQMVEARFMATKMTIYNSVNHTYKNVSSSKFWFEGPQSLILNEEGTLFWKSSIKKSTSSGIVLNNVDLRQVYKASKNQAAAIGDKLSQEFHQISELLTKLLINGFYGSNSAHFHSNMVA